MEMKLDRFSKKFAFLALFLLCSGLFRLLPHAEAALPAERISRVEDLLKAVETIFLRPSGETLKNVNFRDARHLENLSVMIGLVLRSQIRHVQADPSRTPQFMELQGQVMLFLADLTVSGGHAVSSEHYWKEYAAEALNGNYMTYSRTAFKVDPDGIHVPTLLGFPSSSPLPIDLSLIGRGGGGSAAVALLKKAGGGLQAEKDGVTLLGREYGDRTIQPVPEGAVAPNLLGQWRGYINKLYLISQYQKLGDSQTVIHVSKSGDTYIGRVIFAPPGYEAFKGLELFRMKISRATRSAGEGTEFVGQVLRVTTRIENRTVNNETFPQMKITGTRWVNADMGYSPKGGYLRVSSFNSGDQSGMSYTYRRTVEEAKNTNNLGVGLCF